MSRSVTSGLCAVILAGLAAGCSPSYSPTTYSATAVQQANKVERAEVIGFRQVQISATGTVGAVTGGAAGGVLGSQSGQFGINSALGAVGGTAIGSLLGTSIEHVTGDTTGWEYIVRKPDGDLLSVTQREEAPIPVGQKVLVITGSQARIVADYSVLPDPEPTKNGTKEAAKDTPKPDDRKPDETIEAKELPAPPPGDPAPPPAPVATPAPESPQPPAVQPAPTQPSPTQPSDSSAEVST
ncbi:glycine zipper 2TM domain-containing protein [Azospirillum soli]|uniref:outer membrane lipoprotein n=1 Tax=Azospirillum soli TaxID=1304799 RepID=UPI001B3B8A41|nr:outer membrane lipoprotein SlyB [Azospirillum soli]